MINCSFHDNCVKASATNNNGTLTGNMRHLIFLTGDAYGGAVASFGFTVISESNFTRNYGFVAGNGVILGGAVYLYGGGDVVASTFIDNYANGATALGGALATIPLATVVDSQVLCRALHFHCHV